MVCTGSFVVLGILGSLIEMFRNSAITDLENQFLVVDICLDFYSSDVMGSLAIFYQYRLSSISFV